MIADFISMEEASGDSSEMFNSLPQDCISHILSFTSPRDTCRFATLSSLFRSAAESDQVWAQFLPPTHHDLMSKGHLPFNSPSLKFLFIHLCENPFLFSHPNIRSIALDKTTGKICFMISAKGLQISHDWDDWDFPTVPRSESRFRYVGQQSKCLDMFEIFAELGTYELSENTTYVVYLVYKLKVAYRGDSEYTFLDSIPDTRLGVSNLGFEDIPDDSTVAKSCLISKECVLSQAYEYYFQRMCSMPKEEQRILDCYFQTETENRGYYFPKERKCGQWMEVALGEFFNKNGVRSQNFLVEFNWTKTLDSFIIEGIEFRPKI